MDDPTLRGAAPGSARPASTSSASRRATRTELERGWPRCASAWRRPGRTRTTEGSSFARDPREAVAALDTIEPGDRLVVFVGKLIASKGVELLLAAFPLVLAREPRARLVIVGFGAFRAGLEELARAARRRRPRRRARATRGRGRPRAAAAGRVLRRPRGPEPTRRRGRLRRPRGLRRAAGPRRARRPAARPRRRWRSPAPSRRRSAWSRPRRPRCGTLPVVAEPLRASARSPARCAEAVPRGRPPVAVLRGRPDAVVELADALSGWLAAPDDLRAPTRDGDRRRDPRRATPGTGVARTVIAAAQGDLDDLPPQPKGTLSFRCQSGVEERRRRRSWPRRP